ncbi:Mei5p TDEL_0A05640 [Torulaspora delbrueckii]|uniref:Uncharacterized protein n=1 Tax=Torulaspora delbrueckii TaxID=4950 RepID=G8ZMQ2_TORDE|nr:hypothetical protein TDEL_0A05640 [Torulaspora delbrueckii]CCE89896.1 hypothetical protein TDEL_0A05640 [Torulaspora delbrueckii]
MDDTTIINSSPVSDQKGKNSMEICSPTKTPVESVSKYKTAGKHLVQKSRETLEDHKLNTQTRLLYNELSKQKNLYKKHIDNLAQAIKIIKAGEKESRVLELIEKWRGVAQAGMSFMLNSAMLKITKLGGYEELLKKELEAERRKLDYQINDNLQDDMEQVFESEEFLALPEEMQQEYRDQMNEQLREVQNRKDKEIAKLEAKMKESAGQEMTMQELSRRIKMDYMLIFPE